MLVGKSKVFCTIVFPADLWRAEIHVAITNTDSFRKCKLHFTSYFETRKKQHGHKIKHQHQHNSTFYQISRDLQQSSFKYHSSESFISPKACRVFINSLNQLILRKRGVALRVYRDKISKAYMKRQHDHVCGVSACFKLCYTCKFNI